MLKGVQSLSCAQVVGISFGHQMVVQALGGKVESAHNNLPEAPPFLGWKTRTEPVPAGNPYGSSVSKMGTKLTPEAQRYFGTNRSGFDLLYHHNDAVTRMPGPAAGLIEMGGNRTTPNNGVFDMRGTVLTFCGHPVRFALPLSPPLPLSFLLQPLRPRCLDLVRGNHRRITRTAPPSCTSCSRSIAT